MKSKDEVAHIFRIFHKMVQKKFHACMLILRSDNGVNMCLGNFKSTSKRMGSSHRRPVRILHNKME
jgi:hypothetical protein